MLKLYYAPNSCALATHIALAEAGADYELVRIDYATQDQRAPAFLALNPLGRIPVLVTARGVLTEVPAILRFVAASFPAARLAPADPFTAAEMDAFNSFLCSTVHVTFAHFMRADRWLESECSRKELSERARPAYADLFTMIEAAKLRGPWVMGEQFTVADPYLYLLARWLVRADLDIATWPRVAEHFERVEKRPAVQKALAEQGLA